MRHDASCKIQSMVLWICTACPLVAHHLYAHWDQQKTCLHQTQGACVRMECIFHMSSVCPERGALQPVPHECPKGHKHLEALGFHLLRLAPPNILKGVRTPGKVFVDRVTLP